MMNSSIVRVQDGHSIFVSRVDILLLRRDSDFDFVGVLLLFDNTKVGADLVVTFSTPRDIMRVCKLEYAIRWLILLSCDRLTYDHIPHRR